MSRFTLTPTALTLPELAHCKVRYSSGCSRLRAYRGAKCYSDNGIVALLAWGSLTRVSRTVTDMLTRMFAGLNLTTTIKIDTQRSIGSESGSLWQISLDHCSYWGAVDTRHYTGDGDGFSDSLLTRRSRGPYAKSLPGCRTVALCVVLPGLLLVLRRPDDSNNLPHATVYIVDLTYRVPRLGECSSYCD